MSESLLPHGALAVLVLAFVALATAYNVAVPVFENPDEPQHFFFAQHLADSGRLPVQTLDDATRSPWEQEGSQPPLYYALAAPLLMAADAELGGDDLRYNHQNTMGTPALVGNENRYIHAPDREGWPWHGYALAVHPGRALSTLLGAIAVGSVAAVTSRVVRSRDPDGSDPRWMPIAAASVVAFNPQFLAVSSTFSNDALVVALTTVALALLLRVADGHDGKWTLIGLAIVVGLAPLAKLSGLALVGLALLTLVFLSWRREDRRLLLVGGGLVLLAAAVLGGWWFIRNQMLYGEPTGLSHMLAPGLERDFNPERWLRGLPGEMRGMWYSSWGLFGWFTVMSPAWFYSVTIVAAVAALGGVVIAALRRAGWVRWSRLAWLLLWSVVVLASLLRWMTMAKGAHGRLMFPAIATLAVVLVIGWRAIVPARLSDRSLAVALALVMGAISLFALFGVIRPAYAWPETIAEEDIPASALRADVVFDGKVRLIAADVPDRATEGDVVPVTLYWQVLETITRDGLVALRVDQETSDIPSFAREVGGWHFASSDADLAHPGDGSAPWSQLTPSDGVVVDRQHVVVPSLERAVFVVPGEGTPIEAPAMPLSARLSVHLYDAVDHVRWPGVHAEPVPDPTEWSTSMVIDPAVPIEADTDPDPPADDGATGADWTTVDAPLGEPTVLARFDNGVVLHGVGVGERVDPASDTRQWWSSARVADERQSIIRNTVQWTGITWLPGDQVDAELRAFVHVVDEVGSIVAQFDGTPAAHGPYPTNHWRADEPIVAVQPWYVPGDAPRGRYRLLLGLYDPISEVRVPAYQPDGVRWPDDAVPVAAIEVTD